MNGSIWLPVKEDIMNTRYSAFWSATSVDAAGELAGSGYLATLLLALLGEKNISQRFAGFRQIA
jgi:hypothetical protein